MRALWTLGAVAGTFLVVGGVAWVATRVSGAKGVSGTLVPGTMHISGFRPGDGVTLYLPAGARWGGVTDFSGKQPTGSGPFTFHEDDTKAASGVIGATWWDAQNVARATTITYGP